MKSNGYELNVLVETSSGKVSKIPEYGYQGNTYVEGRKGQKYRLQFKNNTFKRVLIVPSIDGRSVLDDGPATSDSRGYIVEAYSNAEIKGWRTSLEDINRFKFEPKERSYTSKAGDGTMNCGVIGLLVYEENVSTAILRVLQSHTEMVEHHHHHHHYPPPPPTKPWPDITWTSPSTGDPIPTFGGTLLRSHSCGPIMEGLGPEKVTAACVPSSLDLDATYGCCADDVAPAPKFNLGTGFGEHEKDVVGEMQFTRGVQRASMTLYYADGRDLRRLGIRLEKAVALERMPQAFKPGFCKPV